MRNSAIKSLISATEVDSMSALIFTANGAYIRVSGYHGGNSSPQQDEFVQPDFVDEFCCPNFAQSCERIMGIKIHHFTAPNQYDACASPTNSPISRDSIEYHPVYSLITFYGGRSLSLYTYNYNATKRSLTFCHIASFTATQAILDVHPVASTATPIFTETSATHMLLSLPIVLASAVVQLLHVAFPMDALPSRAPATDSHTSALKSHDALTHHTEMSRDQVFVSLSHHTIATTPSLLYHATLHTDPTIHLRPIHGPTATSAAISEAQEATSSSSSNPISNPTNIHHASLSSTLARTVLSAGSAMGSLLRATPLADISFLSHSASDSVSACDSSCNSSCGEAMSVGHAAHMPSRRSRPASLHLRDSSVSSSAVASQCGISAADNNTLSRDHINTQSPVIFAIQSVGGQTDATDTLSTSETLALFPWNTLHATAASLKHPRMTAPTHPSQQQDVVIETSPSVATLPLMLFAPPLTSLLNLSRSSPSSTHSANAEIARSHSSIVPASAWAAQASMFPLQLLSGPRGSILHVAAAPTACVRVAAVNSDGDRVDEKICDQSSRGEGETVSTEGDYLCVPLTLPVVVTASDDRSITVWAPMELDQPSNYAKTSNVDVKDTPTSEAVPHNPSWRAVSSTPMHAARPFRVRCLTPRATHVRTRSAASLNGRVVVDARVCVPVVSAGEDRVVRLTRIVMDVRMIVPAESMGRRVRAVGNVADATVLSVGVENVKVTEIGAICETQGHIWCLGELPPAIAADSLAASEERVVLVGDAGGALTATTLGPEHLWSGCDELAGGAQDNSYVSVDESGKNREISGDESPGEMSSNTAVQAQGKDASRKHVSALAAAPAVSALAVAQAGAKVLCADAADGWLCFLSVTKAAPAEKNLTTKTSLHLTHSNGVTDPVVTVVTPANAEAQAMLSQARGMCVHAVDPGADEATRNIALICVWNNQKQVALCTATAQADGSISCSEWVMRAGVVPASIATVRVITSPPADLHKLLVRAANRTVDEDANVFDMMRSLLLCVVDVRGFTSLSMVSLSKSGLSFSPVASVQLSIGNGVPLTVAMMCCEDQEHSRPINSENAAAVVNAVTFTVITGTNKGDLSVSVCACHRTTLTPSTPDVSLECRVLRSITINERLECTADSTLTNPSTATEKSGDDKDEKRKSAKSTSSGNPILQLQSVSSSLFYCLAKDQPLQLFSLLVRTIDTHTNPSLNGVEGENLPAHVDISLDNVASWSMPAGYQPEQMWVNHISGRSSHLSSSPARRTSENESKLPSLLTAGFTDSAFSIIDLASGVTLANLPLKAPRKHAWGACLCPTVSTLETNGMSDGDHSNRSSNYRFSWLFATTAPAPPETFGIRHISTEKQAPGVSNSMYSGQMTLFSPIAPPTTFLSMPVHARLITGLSVRHIKDPRYSTDDSSTVTYVATSSDDGTVSGFALVPTTGVVNDGDRCRGWTWQQRQWSLRVTDDTAKSIAWPHAGASDGITSTWALACGGKGQLCVLDTPDVNSPLKHLNSNLSSHEINKHVPQTVSHQPWTVRARHTQHAHGAQPRMLSVDSCAVRCRGLGECLVAATGSSMGALEVLLVSCGDADGNSVVVQAPEVTSLAIDHSHAAPVMHSRILPLPAHALHALRETRGLERDQSKVEHAMLLVSASSRGEMIVWLFELLALETRPVAKCNDRKRKADSSPLHDADVREASRQHLAEFGTDGVEAVTILSSPALDRSSTPRVTAHHQVTDQSGDALHASAPMLKNFAGRLTPLVKLPVHGAGVCGLDVTLESIPSDTSASQSGQSPRVFLHIASGGDDAIVAFTRICLQFAPTTPREVVQDSRAVVMSEDGPVRVSVEYISRRYEGHSAAVKAVVFLPSDTTNTPALSVATAGSDQRVCLWQWQPSLRAETTSASSQSQSTAVSLLSVGHTAVSDVECASACASGLIVAGKGMEFISIRK